ncbi:MAG: flagellar hook assembly protein FlgD [Proteobacteria bacterium]|nr:flagellar hook assembly protein FlgD [Pseudomonadota bacterium]
MPTSGLTGLTATIPPAQATSASEAARTKIANNLDTFLKMLTTQLQNQDPIDPMKTNEFTTQLVQFAGVEQQIATNANLEKLLSLQQASQMADAASYIDKTVEAEGAFSPLSDGQAEFAYTLPQPAKQVRLTVANALGVPVYQTSGESTAGTHHFTWDGRDVNGIQLPDGSYGLTVVALDGQDRPIPATTGAIGAVSAVSVENGELMLWLNKVKVPVSKVTSIRAPAAP